MCSRKGYLHWIVPRSAFRLIAGAAELSTYRFGTRRAQHHFCRHCGVGSFYVPRSHPDGVDVNARCLDGVDAGIVAPVAVRRPALGRSGRGAPEQVPRGRVIDMSARAAFVLGFFIVLAALVHAGLYVPGHDFVMNRFTGWFAVRAERGRGGGRGQWRGQCDVPCLDVPYPPG